MEKEKVEKKEVKKVKFTQKNAKTEKPDPNSSWIRDAELRGLRLYVAKDDRRTWYIRYDAEGKRNQYYKLGAADVLSVPQVREMARDFLARLARGEKPYQKKPAVPTLGEYLETTYAGHLSTRRTGKRILNDLKNEFAFLSKTKLDAIQLSELTVWQEKKKNTFKSATVNLFATYLKASLNFAVEIGLIEKNPLARFRNLKRDDSVIHERYLTEDEYSRLIAALDAPGIPAFMKPLVILALNSGIRKGSILALTWRDIDLNGKNIIVRAESSKSGKQINLPLSDTAAAALAAWKARNNSIPSADSLVFVGTRSGQKMGNFNSAWYRLLKITGIENFRFHDCRHHYASRLVMSGEHLATVQKLCGHSSVAQTGRYAHLAPEGLRKAVETLDKFHEESVRPAKEA